MAGTINDFPYTFGFFSDRASQISVAAMLTVCDAGLLADGNLVTCFTMKRKKGKSLHYLRVGKIVPAGDMFTVAGDDRTLYWCPDPANAPERFTVLARSV